MGFLHVLALIALVLLSLLMIRAHANSKPTSTQDRLELREQVDDTLDTKEFYSNGAVGYDFVTNWCRPVAVSPKVEDGQRELVPNIEMSKLPKEVIKKNKNTAFEVDEVDSAFPLVNIQMHSSDPHEF